MQCRSKTKHFNPRSYKRSDDPEFDLFSPKFEISIHAPTRGATDNQRDFYRHNDISIHAPTRGATSLHDFVL